MTPPICFTNLGFALREKGFRSNGFSLVRYILENIFGKDVYHQESPFGKSWGEILLEPSTIYSAELLKILGRFGEKRKFKPWEAEGRVKDRIQAIISRINREGISILLALSIPLTTPE